MRLRAWIFLALCACDVDHGPPVDVSVPDAARAHDDAWSAPEGPDAAVLGAPDAVTVVVRVGWSTLDEILFHDASGAILEAVAPQSGVASSTAAGIAMVTVPGGLYAPSIITIEGVQPGDVVRIEPGLDQRSMVVPSLPAGASDLISATSACGGAYLSRTTSDTCLAEGPVNAGLSLSGPSAGLCWYSAIFDGADEDVLTVPAWRTCDDVEAVPLTLLGAPIDLPVTSASGAIATPYLYPVFAGDGNCGPSCLGLWRGIAPGSSVLATGFAQDDTGAFVSSTVLLPQDRRAGATLDLGAAPRITSTAIDRSDPAHPAVTWAASGTWGRAELTVSNLWLIAAPAPTSRIVMPSLPPDLESRLADTDWQLQLLDTADGHDWRAYVAHPIGPHDPLGPIGGTTAIHGAF